MLNYQERLEEALDPDQVVKFYAPLKIDVLNTLKSAYLHFGVSKHYLVLIEALPTQQPFDFVWQHARGVFFPKDSGGAVIYFGVEPEDFRRSLVGLGTVLTQWEHE